jgi:translocation and assembly module TamB
VVARVLSEALFSSPAGLLERSDTEVRAQAEALELAWVAGLLGREPGEIGGRLDLDVVARGAPDLPIVTGTLRLADGRVAAGDLDEPLGPIEAALRIESDALHIESIRVPGGAGAIRASGTLALRDAALGESDVQIAIDAFELPKGAPATGSLDGALHLTGAWPQLRLDGRIALADALVDLGIRRDPVWSEIRVHGLPGETPLAEGETRQSEGGFPAALLPASADVAIEIPPDTRVQGNGADLRIEGNVRVLKHAGALPLYLGGIRVVEGLYKFQNRRFEIERGTVTLTGGREIDPEIDVVAVQKLREVTLRVVVSGRASAPDASLQSDPPMDPSDQLSYLAFGRPASSLGGNDAAQLQSAATQVIGQLAFADFGSELEGLIPLDAVRVEGGAEGVGIGGNIAPGIYLRYSHDIATNNDQVGVEWQFRPRWMLRSEAKSDGNAGADVIWSFDY